ncbi:MAG: hypothetical protein E7632_09335, partial [Ruminococcaceae bacterium]|nr:hypothetical protein [Oscillospiraceae bacterium]
MKLNPEQIKSITVGAADVIADGESFRFHRFTAAQMECYRMASKDFYNKTLAPAGVRLAFYTDSDRLSFGYHFGKAGSSRQYAYIDVLVDGVLFGHFGSEAAPASEGAAELALTGYTVGQAKLVEIELPWSLEASLSDITLADSASVKPAKRPLTLVCYGDSITHGYDATYPSMSYANRLAR